MTSSTFTRSIRLPYPVETVFGWHERPGAFARLSPPWDQPKVLEHVGGIRDGARVVLQVHAGPVPTTWTLEHRDYVANRQFRDVMTGGPFERWVHTHRFTPDGPDATVLEDRIEYALPLGAMGDMVAGGFAADTLARVFAYRHAVTAGDLARHAEYAARPRLRVAITGASGFIGSQLAAFLTTGGHDVVRIGRGAVKPGHVDVRWNPARGELDGAALEGLDAIVHLAGAPIIERWSAEHKRAIRDSRVEGTSLLAHTIASLARKPRVLLSGSAIGIYGNRGDELLDESSRTGSDFLAGIGKAWEEATAPAERAGVRVVHLRTGIVQGAAGGQLAKQALIFRLGAGGKLGDGSQWMSPVALDDVLGIVYFCIMRDDVRGPVNLVSPSPITNEGYTRVLADVLGRPALVPAPKFALRIVLGSELADQVVLASQRVMPVVLGKAGYKFRFPALEPMLRFELGHMVG